MAGSYLYFVYKNGRLVRRRSYQRNPHPKPNNDEYRYFGKKRLVRPIYKKGLHRYSKPWKHSGDNPARPGQLKPILPCGYSSNQLWVGLCRAWNAFTIWKQKNDIEMMQDYAAIIHKIQKMLELPLTEFDFYIGDEYDEDDDESENKDEFDPYEVRGHHVDDYGNDRCDDKDGLYGTSNDVSTEPTLRRRISDEELLEIIEKPFGYSDQ